MRQAVIQAVAVPHSETFGEVFPASMIELVMPAKAVDPYPLLWDGQHAYIEQKLHMIPGPNSAFKTCVYEHPDVDPTVWNAIRLPTHAADYGSTQQLLIDLCKLIHRFAGLTEPAVQVAAYAVLASWLSDCGTCSVCVSIACAGDRAGLQLFYLFSSLYRRAFVLDASSLSSFSSVPGEFHVCPFFDGSKRHGPTELAELVAGGQIVSLGDSVQQMWDHGAFGSRFRGERVDFVVSRGTGLLPLLNLSVQEEIAAEFQPKLLMYRLRNYRDILDTGSVRVPHRKGGLADYLAARIPGDPELQKQIHSVLSDRVQTNPPIRRSLKDVIVETLLCLCHEHPGSIKLSVANLAAAVNAELKRCGDDQSRSLRAIVGNLKRLDLPTDRLRGNVREIGLDPSMRKAIHTMAETSDFELDLRCQECSQIQRYKEESEPSPGSLSPGGIETEEDRALILRMRKDAGKEDDLSPNRESARYAPPVHLIVFRTREFAKRG